MPTLRSSKKQQPAGLEEGWAVEVKVEKDQGGPAGKKEREGEGRVKQEERERSVEVKKEVEDASLLKVPTSTSSKQSPSSKLQAHVKVEMDVNVDPAVKVEEEGRKKEEGHKDDANVEADNAEVPAAEDPEKSTKRKRSKLRRWPSTSSPAFIISNLENMNEALKRTKREYLLMSGVHRRMIEHHIPANESINSRLRQIAQDEIETDDDDAEDADVSELDESNESGTIVSGIIANLKKTNMGLRRSIRRLHASNGLLRRNAERLATSIIVKLTNDDTYPNGSDDSDTDDDNTESEAQTESGDDTESNYETDAEDEAGSEGEPWSPGEAESEDEMEVDDGGDGESGSDGVSEVSEVRASKKRKAVKMWNEMSLRWERTMSNMDGLELQMVQLLVTSVGIDRWRENERVKMMQVKRRRVETPRVVVPRVVARRVEVRRVGNRLVKVQVGR